MQSDHECSLPAVTLPARESAPGRHDRVGWTCPECGRQWAAAGWEPAREPETTPVASGLTSQLRGWPDAERGPLRLRVWFEPVGGRPSVVGVELWGREPVAAPWPLPSRDLPPHRVTANDVHTIRLGELLDAHVTHQRAFGRAVVQHVEKHPESAYHDPALPTRAQQAVVEATDANSFGRPRKGEAHYAAIARRYRQLVDDGVRNPSMRIADEYEVKETTARTWVRRAGERGFLPRGRPGAIRDLPDLPKEEQ